MVPGGRRSLRARHPGVAPAAGGRGSVRLGGVEHEVRGDHLAGAGLELPPDLVEAGAGKVWWNSISGPKAPGVAPWVRRARGAPAGPPAGLPWGAEGAIRRRRGPRRGCGRSRRRRAEDDDVGGGAEVGPQVAHGLAGRRFLEAEGEGDGLAGVDVTGALQGDPHPAGDAGGREHLGRPVGSRGPLPGRSRRRPRPGCPAGARSGRALPTARWSSAKRRYSPGAGKVTSRAYSPGAPVGWGWTCWKCCRSRRTTIRCTGCSWLMATSRRGAPWRRPPGGRPGAPAAPARRRGGEQLGAHAGLGGGDGRGRGDGPGGGRAGAVLRPGQEEGGGADAEGHDGDARQVGVLAHPLEQGRVQDLLGALGGPEAAQAQGVGDHADAAHRHRRRGQHRAEEDPEQGYSAPIATGIRTTL